MPATRSQRRSGGGAVDDPPPAVTTVPKKPPKKPKNPTAGQIEDTQAQLSALTSVTRRCSKAWPPSPHDPPRRQPRLTRRFRPHIWKICKRRPLIPTVPRQI
ncbi:hypothetical protein Bbelb_365740 [Branchiostoma belcheri]|nr:hypothetical protein Bbelb_365740 [Branchiostoma belcheri]